METAQKVAHTQIYMFIINITICFVININLGNIFYYCNHYLEAMIP